MTRPSHRFVVPAALLTLTAATALAGPRSGGGGAKRTSTSSTTADSTTSTGTASTGTTSTERTSPSLSDSTTAFLSWFYTSDWMKLFCGELDPTNIPVLSGDFQSLSASIASPEMLRMQATEAHKISTGKGLVIAVLDGGFNLAHPSIATRLSSVRWDAVSFDDDPNDLGNGCDEDGDGYLDLGVGHGTMVASLVARTAPNAKIMPIRVADDEGYGTKLSLSEGLRFAVENGAHVINVSFHLDTASWGVAYWLDVAEQKGIVVVCAAGNDGLDTLDCVATAPTTLAVGAVDANDVRARFSNHGAGVSIYAPGVDTLAAYGRYSVKSLCRWSGTSFSTPFVAGAAALVRQRHPEWTPADVRKALVVSVDPVQSLAGETVCGGRLNLLKAVKQ